MRLTGRVLITGGSGSVGHALIGRATAEGWDAELTVFSRDEVKQATTAERFPAVRLRLGDVQDPRALEGAMRGQDIVVHAAAYKRVPEAERETFACVGANVIGSMNVLREAMRSPTVHTVIGISTDKACSPINAYGQSKALMERMFQSVRDTPGKRFVLTRYGNVLASRGSVIPALRAQAERGDPITLTDPYMTRFWVTLDDAVDLIVAASEQESGSVLIPRSRASMMSTMAEAIAPGRPVTIIGYRDGEKQHEQLLNEHESPFATPAALDFPAYLLGPLSGPRSGGLTPGYEYRSDTANWFTVEELRAVITAMDEGKPVRALW